MAIENFKCSRHSLVSSIYYRAHHGWARRKICKMKVPRRLKKAILRLAFANTVFHKRTILLISFAEFTESALGILSYPGFTMVGPGENALNVKVYRKLENGNLTFAFANTANTPFIYCTSIMYLSTLQKLPEFDNVMTQ